MSQTKTGGEFRIMVIVNHEPPTCRADHEEDLCPLEGTTWTGKCDVNVETDLIECEHFSILGAGPESANLVNRIFNMVKEHQSGGGQQA